MREQHTQKGREGDRERAMSIFKNREDIAINCKYGLHLDPDS